MKNNNVTWIDVFFLKNRSLEYLNPLPQLRTMILRFHFVNTNTDKLCIYSNRYVNYFHKEELVLEFFNMLIKRTNYPPDTKFLKVVYDLNHQEEKKHQFDFLLKIIKEHYNWSLNELEFQKDFYLKEFEDKEKLKKYFKFFGVKSTYWNKFLK